MLYVLYTFLACVFQTNSFNIKRENNGFISNLNDAALKNKTTTPNFKYYLSTIENSRKAPNLKSNIFDKMLSNEMFSIKQHLYDKGVSPVYISFKNNAATPTLEINQRWPIEKVLYKGNGNSNFKNDSSDISTEHTSSNKNFIATEINTNSLKQNNLKLQVGTKNKVIEVRSFSAMENHNSEPLSYIQQAKRQCSCMKNNPNTICSHHNSGVVQMNTEKICTHTENDAMVGPKCTRTPDAYSISLTYFPYYAYPSYFWGITTDPFHTYYHPDVVNNLKLPERKKYRKIKKPYIDGDLFSESEESEESNDNENQYNYLENDKSESKRNKRPKNEYKKTTIIDTVNYDSDDVKDSESSKKIHNGYVKIIDRDNFVEDIIEDLKVYYNDAVIKHCYCSMSSFTYKSNGLLIYVITFLTFIV